jgi:hypothetical protein
MKRVSLPSLLVGVSLLTSCFSAPPTAPALGPVPEYRERNSVIEVIDHENAGNDDAEGSAMPEWVAQYVSSGAAGIEALGEYAGRYVFIGKQTGNSLDALRLWEAGFSVSRDFSRLVSARIQARFIRAAGGNPGEEFGRYFEAVVKASADATFTGADQESSFWIKKRMFDDDGTSPTGEAFEYFILTSIGRETLEAQVSQILSAAQPAPAAADPAPTREQSAAATRLRGSFFEGF